MSLKVQVVTVAVTMLVSAICLAQPDARRGAEERANAQERRFIAAEPRVGQIAPDFALLTPEGEEIRLADLYAEKPVVLEFGCVTCPVYRGKITGINGLRERVGDAAHWLVVYTIEAHPCDTPDPYTGRIWPHRRNEQEGVLIGQPEDYQARVALARRVAEEYGEQIQVVVDGMDNAVWEAWGKRPNSAFVIGKGGEIVEKQFWADPLRLETVLAQLTGVGLRGDGPAGGDAAIPTPDPRVYYEAGAWVMTDLQYGEVDGYPLLLDAYLPADNGIHPAVVNIHGGGWRGGDKGGALQAVRGDLLTPAGVAVFSINYRLSGIAPYPAAVDDCLAAVRWIREHAAQFDVDPDAMAVWGGSAGGHLALMMGFLEPGADDLGAEGEPLTNFFRCVVAKNPPTDFTADDEMHNERALLAFMGASREEAAERYEQASPVTHLSADDPPVFVMHGTADRTVPYNQALVLQEKMAEAGVPMTLLTFEGAGHGLRGADPAKIQAAMQQAAAFVLEHLAK